jgi:hypothetical protein
MRLDELLFVVALVEVEDGEAQHLEGSEGFDPK